MNIVVYKDILMGKWKAIDSNSCGAGRGYNQLDAIQNLFNRVSGMKVYKLSEIEHIYQKQNSLYLSLDEFITKHFLPIEDEDGNIVAYKHNMKYRDEFILGSL